MVTSWLSDAATRGYDWVYGSSSKSISPATGKETSWASNYYWDYTTSSLQTAYESTSTSLSNVADALYTAFERPRSHVPGGTHIQVQPAVYSGVGWMFKQNPYRSIRGQYWHDQPPSLSPIRNLISAIHVDGTPPLRYRENSSPLDASSHSAPSAAIVSQSETASQLAEGLVRALRDAELQEAVELHASLQYWTKRWDRPILSWLEAGPWVWFSEEGYKHDLVGQRVSQIQAVLTRRCCAIGELQSHLLRAGWQKGVGQWGVLGQGGQWAPSGFDGAMDDSSSPRKSSRRRLSTLDMEDTNLPESSLIASSRSLNPSDTSKAPMYYGHASVFVRKTHGGSIVKDDPALAAWSVDAIRVVRDQLYRAGTGLIALPLSENWEENAGELISEGAEVVPSHLPLWASREKDITTKTSESELATSKESKLEAMENSDARESDTEFQSEEGNIVITNLPAMAAEVSELLNSMEIVLNLQRKRRLEKLKGLSFVRRKWFVGAMGGPLVVYLAFRLLKDGTGAYVAQLAWKNLRTFFGEHVYGPLSAIFNELFSGKDRETISDHKARLDAIESLKNMIKSFLDETFTAMEEEERRTKAENMDMSLIEQTKEKSMKTILEINSVIRMSLIEMQFIKKELLNALYAMDQMMTSNEVNMNMAAVAPAVLMIYGIDKIFRFFYFVLLKVKKSREEIHASFRQVMLDMERLLLMRDSPPSAPPPLTWMEDGEAVTANATPESPLHPVVLNSNDLGMLMLHIHECRTIIWEDRRMSLRTFRDIQEDLAELAGERGAVSVQQQLQIIARMFRTYSFMKVINAGVPMM